MGEWEDRLAEWRNPAMWDEPPTEEQVVRQFVYSTTLEFVRRTEDFLAWYATNADSEDSLDALINLFLDDEVPDTVPTERWVQFVLSPRGES